MKVSLSTKADLLQSSIVDIDQHQKKVITNTLQVADLFGKRPSEINRRITALAKKDLCRIAPNYYQDHHGRAQKYYELNRDQFLLVVMGFTGYKADQFKADFIQLFNQHETELKEWQTGRLIATDITKLANDQVYLLQGDLAQVIPNSKRCTLLFVHIQRAITKAVTGSANTKRAMMTADQLYQVGQSEQQVQREIERLRREGLPSEQIRDDVLAMIKAASKEKTQTTNVVTKGLGLQISNPDNFTSVNQSQTKLNNW